MLISLLLTSSVLLAITATVSVGGECKCSALIGGLWDPWLQHFGASQLSYIYFSQHTWLHCLVQLNMVANAFIYWSNIYFSQTQTAHPNHFTCNNTGWQCLLWLFVGYYCNIGTPVSSVDGGLRKGSSTCKTKVAFDKSSKWPIYYN